MNRWDLIVIGAGAVGSAALRAASETGARVLGIEQHAPANEFGSSHGRSRIFRHAYFEHPEYIPLLRHSTARFESLERESGASLLHRCGMLIFGPPDCGTVLGSLDSARRWGLPFETLDARALRRRFPWFRVVDDAVGVLEANAGIVRPEAAVHAAIDRATARGAEIRSSSRALGITEDASGVAVQTDAGAERAAAVVVATGPWARQLLPELAPLLKVTRQVQAWFRPVPGTDAAAMPCWLCDRGPQRRAVYGLAPDPAAPPGYPKVGLHGSDEIVEPDVGARPVDATDIESIRAACRECAPCLDGDPLDAATCLYTMSPDGNFLVGTRSGCRRTHFAAGLSGHGFKLAPALGDALVDLATSGRTDLPIGFLSPNRFRSL